jgi:hypothetical protein
VNGVGPARCIQPGGFWNVLVGVGSVGALVRLGGYGVGGVGAGKQGTAEAGRHCWVPRRIAPWNSPSTKCDGLLAV